MTRYSAKHRKAQIVAATLESARDLGLYRITMEDVARRAHCARSTVGYHFTSLIRLREEAIRRAADVGDVVLLAEAAARCDPAVKNLPTGIRKRVVRHIEAAL